MAIFSFLECFATFHKLPILEQSIAVRRACYFLLLDLHFLSFYTDKLLKWVSKKKSNDTNKKCKKKYQHKEKENRPSQGHCCLCRLLNSNFVFALIFDLGRNSKQSCTFSNHRLLGFHFGYKSNNLRPYNAWKLVK